LSGAKEAQQPSASRVSVPLGRVATPALGQGNSPAARVPSAESWKLSGLTSVLSQTGSLILGLSSWIRRTLWYT